MSVLTIINLFLLPCLITILLAGAILNYKSIEINKYQQTLMTTFVFWAAIMVYVYCKFFSDIKTGEMFTISFVQDVCSVQVLLLGALCFISLISYPVVVLNATFLSFRSWIKMIAPTFTAAVAYFAINKIAGSDPLVKYASFEEFISNIGSITVISRLSLVVTFSYFWFRNIRRIWHVVPYYNQFIQDNLADSRCNVGWIRRLVLHITTVMCAYFMLLFFSSPFVNMIYLSMLIMTFAYMIEMSLVYHSSVGLEDIRIFRDPHNRKRYVFVPSESKSVSNDDAEHESTGLQLIDEWMERDLPYTNVNFTTNEILETFPQFTRYDLTNMFRSNDETFQSYVRRFRIKRACEIMSVNEENAHLQKTFSMVGFSHYSSFSRAFLSILEITPSDFIKLTDSEKTKAMNRFHN